MCSTSVISFFQADHGVWPEDKGAVGSGSVHGENQPRRLCFHSGIRLMKAFVKPAFKFRRHTASIRAIAMLFVILHTCSLVDQRRAGLSGIRPRPWKHLRLRSFLHQWWQLAQGTHICSSFVYHHVQISLNSIHTFICVDIVLGILFYFLFFRSVWVETSREAF